MRLTTTNKKSTPKSWLFPLALVGAVLLLLSVDLLWKREVATAQKTAIYCDAEQVKEGRFVNGDLTFGGGDFQSADRAKSGRYACRLTKDKRY
ncbi:MAG: hypothetical protein AAF599_05430 [Bacteroidota bacterium]